MHLAKNLFRTITIFLTIAALATSADARKRASTYIDENGVKRVAKTHKIYRNYNELNKFKQTHPKPQDGRPYDVDHIVPLERGGADKASNMQYLPVEEHRKKTTREAELRKGKKKQKLNMTLP